MDGRTIIEIIFNTCTCPSCTQNRQEQWRKVVAAVEAMEIPEKPEIDVHEWHRFEGLPRTPKLGVWRSINEPNAVVLNGEQGTVLLSFSAARRLGETLIALGTPDQ